MKIYTILRKDFPCKVRKLMVKDLNVAHCSDKFLSHELSIFRKVYVKCDDEGNLIKRGKKQKYSILNVEEYDVVGVETYPPKNTSFMVRIKNLIKKL